MCTSELYECVQQKPLTFPTGNHNWCFLTLLFVIFLLLAHLLKAYQRVVTEREGPHHHSRDLPLLKCFLLSLLSQISSMFLCHLGLLPGLASKRFEKQFCVLPLRGGIPSSWSDLLLGTNIPKTKCNDKSKASLHSPSTSRETKGLQEIAANAMRGHEEGEAKNTIKA